MNNFSYDDLAREHVKSICPRGAAPAAQLAAIHEAFGGFDAIKTAAVAYCDQHNDAMVAESECDPLDVDDFKCALEDAINDECESLLHDVEVTEDLEDAKASVIGNACWREYAANVMLAIESASENDDVIHATLRTAGASAEEADAIMSTWWENDSDLTAQHAWSVLETYRRDFINQLTSRIASGEQDVVLSDFQERLQLPEGWGWSDVESRLVAGVFTTDDIERAINAALC